MFDAAGLDAAARYDIEINFKKVGEGWDDLSAGVGKFTSAIDGAISKLGAMAAGVGVAAIGGAIAGVTWGVAHLNAEAEKASISIGTIFSANGMASGVPQGIELAGQTIAKMRVDAQKLPGEFEDLQNIFMTGAVSAFRSGASIDQWQKLSAKTMAAAAVTGLPMDQAAREMAQLLEGRSGAHNVFGMRLMGLGGDKAQAFNKMDAGARMSLISTELDKYAGSIDAFSHSWDGLTSTFIDNVKSFGREATSPLFDEVKSTLGDINDWFTKNQGEVSHWATNIGLHLKKAFQWGEEQIKEWGPLVIGFAEAAETKLMSVWNAIEPAVQSFAGAMKEALADPNGTIEKLTHLAELMIGLRVGAGLIGAVGAMGTPSGRVGVGTAIATAGVGAALVGAGDGREAAAAAGGGMIAGSAAGPLGALVGGAVASVSAAIASIVNYESVKRAGEEAALQRTWKFGESLWRANDAVNDFKAKHGEAGESFRDAAEKWAIQMEESGNSAEAALIRLDSAAIEAAAGLSAMFDRGRDAKDKEDGDRFTDTLRLGILQQSRNFRADADKQKLKPTMKGGHGGAHIQKVEIVVTNNNNPSRVARTIDKHLAKFANNRRVSPDVPNYSTPDKR